MKTEFSNPTFQANLVIDPTVKIKGKSFLQRGFRYLTKENPNEVLILASAKKQSDKKYIDQLF